MATPNNKKKSSTSKHEPNISLTGRMLSFTRLNLNTSDLDAIKDFLASHCQNKHTLYPVLIDAQVDIDLTALVDLLWQWGLQPIGVVKGVLDEQATKKQMAIFPADGKRINRLTTTTTKAANSAPAKTVPTNLHLVHEQMLRSGQSINHVGGDLILTNSINDGAEAITDNSLHIYGRAQGRLVAGATGDKNAKIFCQVFNPSLVSVAGTYCLRDNIPKNVIDKPVQVSFEEKEGLIFKLMNNS